MAVPYVLPAWQRRRRWDQGHISAAGLTMVAAGLPPPPLLPQRLLETPCYEP